MVRSERLLLTGVIISLRLLIAFSVVSECKGGYFANYGLNCYGRLESSVFILSAGSNVSPQLAMT
jgi:hypothetical protein